MLLMKKEPKKIKIREKKGLFGPVKEWEAEYVFVEEPEREAGKITDGISWAIRQDLDLPDDVDRHITHTLLGVRNRGKNKRR
ncbi:hypothetical protein VFC49_01725 [Thermococcus sp. SY098]|uniref:hypothetical protein n=1 Tax=Thermococcus sp. SY098 TaxID=3111325 RepID=UPI002D7A25E5|nr:hypothetical protein [Thermococcus sp. SY098]WRS52901.1 hypothetical protein VFC49_01725 [Thermococcus sp. SY098]